MGCPELDVISMVEEWLAARLLRGSDVAWTNVPVAMIEEWLGLRGVPAQPRLRVVHELKCHPEPFLDLVRGEKTFEFRRDDRDFMVGDVLVLREWFGASSTYSGSAVYATVSYVARGGRFGIPEGYCVMSLSLAARARNKEEEEAQA